MTTGEILDGMFRLLLANWRVYLIALGVIVIPFNIVVGWLTSEAVGGVGFWLDMFRNPMAPTPAPTAEPSAALGVSYFAVQFLSTFVVTPLTWGLATHLATGAYERRALTVGGVWRGTLHRFWGLLGAMVLLYLVLFAAFFVGAMVVGVLAFWAPTAVVVVAVLALLCVAVWFGVKLSLTIPALIVEGAGPGTALGRSWRLVRGRFWRVLGILALLLLILMVISMIFIAGFALIGAIFGTVGAIVAGVIGSFVVGMLTTPLTFNGLTLLYFDSRIRGEAYDLDVMTSQLQPYPPYGAGPAPGAEWPLG